MVKAWRLTPPGSRRGRPAEGGSLLVEALVVGVLVTIALAGTLSLVNLSAQQRNRSRDRNQLNAAIDTDLAAIEDQASRLTCCSGVCTLAAPTQVGADSPCATTNRRDDRFFYPQLNDPDTTVNEPEAVDAICAEPNAGILSAAVLGQFNAIPVNAALTAAGGARQPIVRLRSVVNQPRNQNILLITYTDTAQNGAVVRVARVVPPMARFCP